MKTINIEKIDLGKLARELRRYELQWIAISEENRIVAHGRTYGETVGKVKRPEEVVLFKVPPMNYSLAPTTYEVQVPEILPRTGRSH